MEHEEFELNEWYDEADYCNHCNSELESEDCWSCGGTGGRDYDNDLQFEDPLWYSPGDFEICDVCEGTGHLSICPNKECKPDSEE